MVVLKVLITVVNISKGSSLNSWLFEVLCLELQSNHTHLLYYTEVQWLSWGKVLTRVHNLKEEIHHFLLEKWSDLADLFCDDNWMISYLADIFSILSELNLKLQGRNNDLFRHWEQIQVFQKSFCCARPDLEVIVRPATYSQHCCNTLKRTVSMKKS